MYTKISTISIIVPFYNEGKGVDEFFKEINPILQKINNIKFEYKICYGSISDLVLFNNIKRYKCLSDSEKQQVRSTCSKQFITIEQRIHTNTWNNSDRNSNVDQDRDQSQA